MLDRVCDYMGVVPDLVDLRFYRNEPGIGLVDERGYELGLIAGTYEEGSRKYIIRIDMARTHDAMGLVSTLAHELAHSRILGEGRAMSEEYDNELLTDLTVVHLGLGVFLANKPAYWLRGASTWPGTTLCKPEYMTAPMIGYALAHVAWFHSDANPAWAKALHLGPRANFRQALRFLRTTRDSRFQPWPIQLGLE